MQYFIYLVNAHSLAFLLAVWLVVFCVQFESDHIVVQQAETCINVPAA